MSAFEERFIQVNRALVGLAMGGIFVLVFVNVVLRYGFGTSLSWVEEVARFLMIWGAFLGAGLALREGRHVAIDVLQDRLPEPTRRLLRIVIGVAVLVFMAGLAYLGLRFVIFGWDKVTMALQISRGIPYLAVPLGCALFIVHLLLFFRRFLARDWEEVAIPQDDGLEDRRLVMGRE
ncbi:MAG: TRAP transporter small permease [Alphaproteobacteria bacterium]|nr:TRAP transporter small permease [Alphaproteobacteria bacterium]